MSIKEIISLECGCEKCGYVWRPRTDKPPEVCPKCKRRDWNFEKVEKEVERIIEPKAVKSKIPIEQISQMASPEKEVEPSTELMKAYDFLLPKPEPIEVEADEFEETEIKELEVDYNADFGR